MMKISTLLAFFFLTFAFALSIALGRSIAAFDAELVLDSDGKPIVSNGWYAFVPATPGNGGAIGLSQLDGEECPLSVVQSPSNNSFNSPLTFEVISPHPDGYVYTTDFMDIKFVSLVLCGHSWASTKWIVNIFTPVPTVFIGEVDERTVEGHFRIQKYEDAYKLAFCPDRIPGTCWDLGISPFGSTRLVAYQENPFKLVFQNVLTSKSASII